jgi:tRNA/rRNA methyltransferase
MTNPESRGPAPAIILIKPQMGENIGATARAMRNFGLTDLRLVAPRDGWPNPAAIPMSAGATEILDNAKLYRDTEEAIADLRVIYATTARSREMVKPAVTPSEAAREIAALANEGTQCGILFGPEKSGLHNDDVALSDKILQIPANPEFTSLNLAQAVLIIGYAWFTSAVTDSLPPMEAPMPAPKEDLVRLFEHLESELDSAGFFRPAEKRPSMVRNLRNLLQNSQLSEQDVRTLRGVIKALTRNAPESVD